VYSYAGWVCSPLATYADSFFSLLHLTSAWVEWLALFGVSGSAELPIQRETYILHLTTSPPKRETGP
jgi:hypothetical protein